MVVETKDRPVGRPRVRRATALAGMLLAFGAVAGCGSGGTGAADGVSATLPPAATVPSASPSPSATPAQPPSASPSPSATSVPSPAPPGGAGTTPGSGPAGTPTPAAGPDGPAPTGPGIAPGEPAPVPGGLQSMSYRTDGNRLTVWFYGGICEKYGLKVDESRAGQVGIRFVATSTMAPGQACAAVAMKQSVTAELAKPLMGRAVLDTARGTEVPLEADPHVAPTEPSQR